ncbi:MAG TPA: hypothetical protein VFG62_10075 [Rhodopila sp.]|jgi:hypothetical protein|nr:hypothetical protein [Rhodopila sp.]
MSIADLPEALLKTILGQIATLLLDGASGDRKAAWLAAVETIRAHDPQTEQELRLAARIVAFSLQAGEALAQAADPNMPLTRVLRLRTGAVSLSREAEKAERRLEKLREARLRGLPEDSEPLPEPQRAGKTTELIDDNRKVAAYARANGLSWTEALKQRRREQRLAERHRKQELKAQAA